MKKWVYLFEEVAAAEKYAGSWEGVRCPAGRQRRWPVRYDARGRTRSAWLYGHDRSLQ